MGIIIVWLIFGYACYYIAREKGLNAALWGLLGVLFGIFTLIIVLLIPSNKY